MNRDSKILIYGAGVIGSIFAGMIAKSGYNITILARGKHHNELHQNGLVLNNCLSGEQIKLQVNLINVLNEDDIYDYIIVIVQNTQIDSILPILSKNKSPNIVFVVNNPSGYQKWIDAVGYERIMIGFPSAGGERKDGMVNYYIGKGIAKIFQATTFGELNGEKTKRLLKLVRVFKDAGFAPSISNNMDAWQKTHVAVILPIGKALNRFDSNNYKLAKSSGTIKQMLLATRECFEVLKELNIKVTPSKLNIYYLPLFLLVPIFMRTMDTKIAETAYSKHNLVAQNEMEILEEQFRALIASSGVKTPNFNSL
ncbi:MAG TPA: ketopantoate reductase family protein [Firmicutes bacterium]|jgi:2-dehydropantoate 2-reductase|nr:ketopantoate reductase family protein [Bacillota bacterium]